MELLYAQMSQIGMAKEILLRIVQMKIWIWVFRMLCQVRRVASISKFWSANEDSQNVLYWLGRAHNVKSEQPVDRHAYANGSGSQPRRRGISGTPRCRADHIQLRIYLYVRACATACAGLHMCECAMCVCVCVCVYIYIYICVCVCGSHFANAACDGSTLSPWTGSTPPVQGRVYASALG